VEGVQQHLRIPISLSRAIDAWIARQPGRPRPSRPEAIRRLLAEALRNLLLVEGQRQSDASLDRQISEQETAIAEMPEYSEPSPEAGIAAMDRALAENDLTDMKNKLMRRKNASPK
jgi:hypothetical protein